MITSLVYMVIYIVVVGLVIWLLLYLIDAIPLPEPFHRVARGRHGHRRAYRHFAAAQLRRVG